MFVLKVQNYKLQSESSCPAKVDKRKKLNFEKTTFPREYLHTFTYELEGKTPFFVIAVS